MRARVVMGWVEAPEEPEPEPVEEDPDANVFAPSPEHLAEAEAVGEARRLR